MEVSKGWIKDVLEVAFEAGNHYTSSDKNKMLRIAKSDTGMPYAGRAEPRSDYADETLAFVNDYQRDYNSVAVEVKEILMNYYFLNK